MIEDVKFISDPVLFGRPVAELEAADHALVRSYVWGLDLSGSLDGAGGVGGLLWVRRNPGEPSTHYCAYDGNGNIVGLFGASDGSETAWYEYGPFGEPIRATGAMAKENPFRFSTKRTDSATDLVLYEFRLYNPSSGRWLNRDPLNELGFRVLTNHRRLPFACEEEQNLYAFVRNNPVSIVDPFGLWDWPWSKKKKECCKEDDEGTKAAKELANQALQGLVDNLAEAAKESGSQAAKSLEVLKKAMFIIGAAKSICDAKKPDGCDEFIKSGELVDCMLCCTSIHSLFSNELGGVGFLISCKYACRNAD